MSVTLRHGASIVGTRWWCCQNKLVLLEHSLGCGVGVIWDTVPVSILSEGRRPHRGHLHIL